MDSLHEEERTGQEPTAAEQNKAAEADQEESMSFAQMLAQEESEQSGMARFTPGQRVRVRIVAITADTVFVSTGAKIDGIVDREELLEDGELPYQVDDYIDLYVVSANSQEVKLAKIIRGAGSLQALEDAFLAKLPVEGKITALTKGGFAVEVMKRKAFCPLSQIDLFVPSSPDTLVGKSYPFLITRFEGSKNIVLSRRALLEKDQEENRKVFLENLPEDKVVEAKIVRIVPFGAFAELAPCVEGLIHISELSWARVNAADEVVSIDDLVRVKVLGVDESEKGTRISLSMRQVTGDPWASAQGRIEAGMVLPAKVVHLHNFGAFVEIFPGIEGLIHISEFSYEKRINKPEEVLAVGDHVDVKVKEFDFEKKRVSLSLRDVAGNPWDTVAGEFHVGQELVGTLEKRAPFGLFVTLAPGVTGLLPNALQGSAKSALAKLAVGDSLSVRIDEIAISDRKITLRPCTGEEADAIPEREWKQALPKAKVESFGSLGSILSAAMNSKKK